MRHARGTYAHYQQLIAECDEEIEAGIRAFEASSEPPAAEADAPHEEEGRQEGRIETLEQLVRSGLEWPLIESAAGNDPDTLRALKERLAPEQTNGHADGADQPERLADQPEPPR